MKNNDFDKIIKDNLEGLSVTPSENVGKALGRKMLFKNLWFFHKQKVVMILLLIGASTYPLWNFSDSTIDNSAQQIVEKTVHSNKIKSSNSINTTSNKNSNQDEHNQTRSVTSATETPNTNLNQNIVDANPTSDQDSYSVAKQTTKNKNNAKSSSLPKTSTSLPIGNNIEHQQSIHQIAEKKSIQPARFSNKQAHYLVFEHDNKLVNYSHQQVMNDDYAISKKGRFSADAFVTLYNHTKVNNILDQQYHKNWWDFYRETGTVSSGIEAGGRINYDWKNIVTTTGITYNKIKDYKPKYIYESNDNQYLLNVLGVSEISGVQVNGLDSAHYIFYTAQDDELINRVEHEEYSTYHYLTIPLKTGYEFKASNFSILLQAGLAFNHLVKANGTYLRRYTNSESIDIYYNKGIETALLSRRNSMLQTSYVSLLASLAGNVRVSPSIDLFGEFNYQQNRKPITKEEYFLQKGVVNFGTNFGVKYYFEPRIKNSKLEQKIF